MNEFVNLLNSSVISYTDGSMLNIFVRKFLEIPAHSTVLLCRPFHNHSKFGFNSGENFIYADEDNIVDIVHWLLNSPDKVKELIDNSQELVLRSHSVSAYSKYLFSILSEIQKGSYSGAYWEDGQLLLDQ